MGANHLDNIIITIVLQAAPSPQVGFNPLLLVDMVTNSLNGDRVVTYTELAGATSDETAGFISAATLEAVRVAFAQAIPPNKVKIGRVDTAGAETYADALVLVTAEDADYYGICIDDRTDAELLLMSAAVEASDPGNLFIAQSDDATWKTTGLPPALAALDTRERTVVLYHTTDAQWGDWAWLCNRLAFDPDVKSAPWDAQVTEVTALSPLPNDTEKGFLDANNANHGLPYGSAAYFVDPGVNQNTRPIYEVVTADWFENRLQARIADLKINASLRGDKIALTAQGQAQVMAEINTQFNLGVAAGHFVDGQFSVTAEDITDADRALNRMRFTGSAQLVVSGRIFSFSFFFSRDPITS